MLQNKLNIFIIMKHRVKQEWDHEEEDNIAQEGESDL